MIPRICSLKPLPNFMLDIVFDNGARVLYDVKEDLHLPGYHQLRDIPGLFESVQLDQSRTVVYWSDEIDLPSDAILEYGIDAALYEAYLNDPDKGDPVSLEDAAAALGVKL